MKYLQNNRNSASTLRHDIQYIQVEISKANIWGILNSLKKQRNVIKNICVKKRTSSVGKFQLDMTSSFQVRILIFLKGGRTLLFLLNELGEKSQATIIIGKLINKALSNTYWRVIFEKYFSFVYLKHLQMSQSFLMKEKINKSKEIYIFTCLWC